jgi:hypothetical protein
MASDVHRTGPAWTESPKHQCCTLAPGGVLIEHPATYASAGELLKQFGNTVACRAVAMGIHHGRVNARASSYPLPKHQPHDESKPGLFGKRKPLGFTCRISSTSPAVPYRVDTHATSATWASFDLARSVWRRDVEALFRTT